MSKVFVIDNNRIPQAPVRPAEARILLSSSQAAVWRWYLFTIILKAAQDQEPDELRLKIDPGSKTTGLAIVNDGTGEIIWACELTHRGLQIKDALTSRRASRRRRRNRKTRYRKARFLNRTRQAGWLPPSLQSRVENVDTWVRRLYSYCPIAALSMELVRFDTQFMQNPEIQGVAYVQGELSGYEVREYLLEKWNRACAYCDKQDMPLEIEHIVARSRGGSDGVSNLTLACTECNQSKGNQDVREFLAHDQVRLAKVVRFAKTSLKDTTAVNATRCKLYNTLQMTGLPVEVGTGGRTKYNRTRQNLAKIHWLDAACVGASTPEALWGTSIKPLFVKATGRGSRQMCRMDKYGFPRTKSKAGKRFFRFQTGDMVKAVVAVGAKAGTYVGRVAVRARGNFAVKTAKGITDGLAHRYFVLLQNADGYAYH